MPRIQLCLSSSNRKDQSHAKSIGASPNRVEAGGFPLTNGTRDKSVAPLLKQVQAIVGPEHVTDEAAKCDLATSDVFERSESVPALMVVSPRTTGETSAVIRLLGENRCQ